jgi:UDP-N-acetylglucosamine acyltransferase
MANSHVGHDCRLGSYLVLANSVALAGHVTVEDGVILGGMAGIHQFTRIGELAFIGAGAMVSLDVPPYCIAQGDRAVIRGLNLIGLRRNGFTASDVSEVKKMFRFLFSRTDDGENYKDRILKISPETLHNLKIKKFIDFISQTKRGITIPNRLEVRKQENSTDNEAE